MAIYFQSQQRIQHDSIAQLLYTAMKEVTVEGFEIKPNPTYTPPSSMQVTRIGQYSYLGNASPITYVKEFQQLWDSILQVKSDEHASLNVQAVKHQLDSMNVQANALINFIDGNRSEPGSLSSYQKNSEEIRILEQTAKGLLRHSIEIQKAAISCTQGENIVLYEVTL